MAFTPKNFEYHEWLVKTNFSFLAGASHPKEILMSGIELGYQSLCINDFDGQYGLARTFNELSHIKKTKPTNLKLNYGCEIHLAEDHQKPILQRQTIVLVAKDWDGYTALNQLITKAQKKGKTRAFVTPNELLEHNLNSLFAVVPMRNTGPKDFLFFSNLKEKLNSQLYFALTKTFNHYCDQQIIPTQNFAKSLNCPTLFSQDAFYHHRHLKSFHDLLCAIRTNQHIPEAVAHFFPNGERSFHQKKELWTTYSSFPNFQDTLSLMSQLNEQCSFSLSQIQYQYPKEMIPPGESSQTYLEKLVWQSIRDQYGDFPKPKIVQIVSKELDLIEDLQFADYFLTVWDIVAWARKQDILCQGRGSAANSAVCYFLGITACDPSQFELLFERFMSKERGDPPDIDVDFEHERREEVIQYIYRRYGRKRAAMVANVITYRAKGSLRAVGKALGVSDSTLSQVAKLSSTVLFRSKSLKEVLDYFQKQKSKTSKLPPEFSWSLWSELSQRLRGFPRHLGIHSGGFVISQHAIDQLVPQEQATMEGRTVIQWCKDDIEELGFFKIDCLSLGMLTALRKSFQLIKEAYGKDLSMSTIPQDDSETYAMIQQADTVGVFQIESRAQMSMLPRLKPACFYDLVIEIAIIRPGPIQGKVIHPYLRRRQGKEPITYPDPRIKDALSKTLGVVIFQEQAMRIAMALGDFTPGEANELRKHIGSWGSKDFSRNLNPYLQKLFSGLRRQKIDPAFTEQLIEQMKGFSEYGFPESHAISFAFIAYASCYLKRHYPAAFFVAVLNSQPMGFYSPHALLQAARRENIKVLPLSVQSSQWDHSLEPLEQKENRPLLFGIRLGFRLIKGLSQKAVEAMIQVRTPLGCWKNFEHFMTTTALHRDDYTALAASNAFADLGLQRFEALWRAEAVPFKPLLDIEERKIQWQEKDSFQRAQMDFVAFGTSLETHPVQMIKTQFWPYKIPVSSLLASNQLSTAKDNSLVIVFGMLLAKQAPPSAKGMVFFTLEDETGFLNLAMSPQVYKKFHDTIESSGMLCIQGKLQRVSDYHSILVSKVFTEDKSKVLQLSGDSSAKDQGTSQHIRLKPRNYY